MRLRLVPVKPRQTPAFAPSNLQGNPVRPGVIKLRPVVHPNEDLRLADCCLPPLKPPRLPEGFADLGNGRQKDLPFSNGR